MPLSLALNPSSTEGKEDLTAPFFSFVSLQEDDACIVLTPHPQ
jgi:hypothetical protein